MIPFRPPKISVVLFTAFTAMILLTGCSAAVGAKNSDQENGTEWFNDSFDSGKMAAYDAFRAGAERPFEPVVEQNVGVTRCRLRGCGICVSQVSHN